MADNIAPRVIDNGLSVLDLEADKIYICNNEPTTFAEATVTYALGSKNWGVGGCFGPPADAAPNGREVASLPITDGLISATGTAQRVAVVDSVNSRLLTVTSLASSQSVTAGNIFTLASWKVRIPNQ